MTMRISFRNWLFLSILSHETYSRPSVSVLYEPVYDLSNYQYYDNYEDDIHANNSTAEIASADYGEDVPKLVSANATVTVNLGTIIKLTCFLNSEIHYNGSWMVVWLKDNQIIALGNRTIHNPENRIQVILSNNSSSLHILWSEKEDAGSYVCQMNAALSTQVWFDVKIREEPRAMVATRRLNVTLGQKALFRCLDINNSSIGVETTIIWGKMDSKGNLDPISEGSEFVISATSVEDSGWYICSVDNGWGRNATNQTYLEVQYAPTVKIVQQHENAFMHGGNRTLLVCEVTACPEAEVKWYQNGRLVSLALDTVSTLGNRHFLAMEKDVSPEQGVYECKAANTHGTGSAKITVSDNRLDAMGNTSNNIVNSLLENAIMNILLFFVGTSQPVGSEDDDLILDVAVEPVEVDVVTDVPPASMQPEHQPFDELNEGNGNSNALSGSGEENIELELNENVFISDEMKGCSAPRFQSDIIRHLLFYIFPIIFLD